MQVYLSDASLGSSSGAVVAVVVAAIGAVATFTVGAMNYWTQRKSLQWQHDQQVEQLKLMSSAQITDRFTKAIDQLGSDHKAVRIGGIFALERIACDSTTDASNIVATLAAFIRERLPSSAVHGQTYIPVLKSRAPDVQAALTVLCRAPLSDNRTRSQDRDLLDLSRTDLRRAALAGAHLERVNLWGARLDGANLRNAHLQGSILGSANLGRFDPSDATYQYGADLSGADLTGANLDRVVNLHEVKAVGTIGLPASWCDRARLTG